MLYLLHILFCCAGVQQSSGHTHRTFRYTQSQLDKVNVQQTFISVYKKHYVQKHFPFLIFCSFTVVLSGLVLQTITRLKIIMLTINKMTCVDVNN